MNNRSKLFTRLDAQNNKIPGSSVQRKTSPRVGRWVEETVNLCCAPYTEIADAPNNVTSDVYTVTIDCSSSNKLIAVATLDAATTSLEEVAEALNENIPYLGQFIVSGDTVALRLKQDIADSLCSVSANLGLTIVGS